MGFIKGSKQVAFADFIEISRSSPEIAKAIRIMADKGSLDIAIIGILDLGVAKDVKSALDYMTSLAKQVRVSVRRVTLTDMGLYPDAHFALAGRLKRLLNLSSGGQDPDPLTHLGTIGHTIIASILEGQIPDQKKFPPLDNPQQRDMFDRSNQGNLFQYVVPENGSQSIGTNGKINNRLIAQIEVHWLAIKQSMGENPKWPTWYQAAKSDVHQFVILMKSIFGGYVDVIRSYSMHNSSLYCLLALMSWATALFWYRENGPRTVFSEIPVLPLREGFSLGRIDAITVESLDGRKLNARERKLIRELSRNLRFVSLKELYRYIKHQLRGDPEIKVLDWKFAQGDGKGSSLKEHDLREPLGDHVSQMKRYLSLGSEAIGNFELLQSGDLVYFLSERNPLIHAIKMTPEQKKAYIEAFSPRVRMVIKIGDMTHKKIANGVLYRVASALEKRQTSSSFIDLHSGIVETDVFCQLALIERPNANSPLLERILSQGWRDSSAFQKIQIPVEAKHFMAAAQAHLCATLKGSNGEHYLNKKRCITTNVAGRKVVGFGTMEVVTRLLEDGFSMSCLIDYGFVRKATVDEAKLETALRYWPIFSLVRHLVKSGHANCASDMLVPNGRGEYIYPWFTLQNRLTFPLELDCINSFYGRAVGPKRKGSLPHYKIQLPNIPHGVFRMSVLESNAKEVIVTEGVMDCLSLLSMGYINSIAIVGADNSLAMDILAHCGKNIAIALDTDSTGRDSTLRIHQNLRERGFSGRIRDFTSDFYNAGSRQITPRFREIKTKTGSKITNVAWSEIDPTIPKDFNELWIQINGLGSKRRR